jgi:hypothetical protein
LIGSISGNPGRQKPVDIYDDGDGVVQCPKQKTNATQTLRYAGNQDNRPL